MEKAYTVYLLLGGNQGDTFEFMQQAKAGIRHGLGQIVSESSLYETDPWGMSSEQNFVNQAVCIHSKLSPLRIMDKVLRIELGLGRVRLPGSMLPRTIDIDILLIDDMILSEPGLEIPHPRLHMRRFALEPLNEIAPDLVHPIFKARIADLLNMCDDGLKVRRLPGMMTGS